MFFVHLKVTYRRDICAAEQFARGKGVLLCYFFIYIF